MTYSHAVHLYKAGARLARTGSDRQTLDRWIRDNDLRGPLAEVVRRGYRDEQALRLALGFDRSGRRLGRAS